MAARTCHSMAAWRRLSNQEPKLGDSKNRLYKARQLDWLPKRSTMVPLNLVACAHRPVTPGLSDRRGFTIQVERFECVKGDGKARSAIPVVRCCLWPIGTTASAVD